MSASEHTTWKCDACDREEERPRAEGPPRRWIGVTLHDTAISARASRRLHVCEECMDQRNIAHLIATTGGDYS